MQTILKDIQYALRQLRHSPIFTLTAVLTLGLGLGASATMFQVVHDVLLAPLPFRAPQKLVGIGFAYPQERATAKEAGSTADFLTLHSRSLVSSGIAEDGNTGVNLSFSQGSVTPVQVHARHVSAGYLPTLGVAPLLGRTFTTDEDRPGGPHAVILSYSTWDKTFHHDPGILGRTIQLDQDPYTVTGILPAGFADPSTTQPTQLWEPLQLSPENAGYDGDNYILYGRLRDGVSLPALQAEVSTLNAAFYRQYPSYLRWTNDAKALHGYRTWPLAQVLTSNVRSSLIAMSAAVGSVLLIACLNLAGLMTTRGSSRLKELAIRSALGANRLQLLRIMITEGALLAASGAALGLACTWLLTPLLITASPLPLTMLHPSPSWSTALFLLLSSLAACALFSILPAWQTIGQPSARALPGRSSMGAERSQAWLGKVLVVAQVALATVLLSGASLLLGTFLKLQSTSPGFVPEHLTIAQVTLKGTAYATTSQTTQFLDKVLARLQRIPGVTHVAAIDGIPLDRGLNMGMFPLGSKNLEQTVEFRPVTPAYFTTMGLPLLSGRFFSESDTANTPSVAIVTETSAKKWWPGRSPIGQRITQEGKDPLVLQVIGIVPDTRNLSLAEPSDIMIYAPYHQLPDADTRMINNWFPVSFLIRAADDAPLAQLVTQSVTDADPSLPVARFATMQTVINETVSAPRFFSWLSSSFAVFALLLTILGLFGLLSYQVAQRTRELGLRLALGATRERLLRSVLQRGLVLTGTGLVIGLIASLAIPRLVGSVLADAIYTGDAPITSILAGSSATITVAAAAILIASIFASYLPARRAANTEPMEALRSE